MINLDTYQVGSRLVTVIEPDDSQPQPMDILTAHTYPAQLHRAVSVWLFRQNPESGALETLFQQRSTQKPIGAGWWGNSICANVKPDETYLECAQRRLQEEIGVIGVELQPLYQFQYQAYGNDLFCEHELDQVFMGWFEGQAEPNPAEVSEVAWVEWPQLVEDNMELIESFPSPTDSLSISTEAELQAKVSAPTCVVTGKEVAITPWTVMMLKDHRLKEWVEQA